HIRELYYQSGDFIRGLVVGLLEEKLLQFILRDLGIFKYVVKKGSGKCLRVAAVFHAGLHYPDWMFDVWFWRKFAHLLAMRGGGKISDSPEKFIHPITN